MVDLHTNIKHTKTFFSDINYEFIFIKRRGVFVSISEGVFLNFVLFTYTLCNSCLCTIRHCHTSIHNSANSKLKLLHGDNNARK